MFELKALLTSLTLPRQSEARRTSKDDAKSAVLPDTFTNTSGYTAAQLAPFMRRFDKDSSEGEIFVIAVMEINVDQKCVTIFFH